jgi:hypothetical protein
MPSASGPSSNRASAERLYGAWGIGATGVRRVVERELTADELSGLRQAAEAVRAKQADVASP